MCGYGVKALSKKAIYTRNAVATAMNLKALTRHHLLEIDDSIVNKVRGDIARYSSVVAGGIMMVEHHI
jgi:hypothetical protein